MGRAFRPSCRPDTCAQREGRMKSRVGKSQTAARFQERFSQALEEFSSQKGDSSCLNGSAFLPKALWSGFGSGTWGSSESLAVGPESERQGPFSHSPTSIHSQPRQSTCCTTQISRLRKDLLHGSCWPLVLQEDNLEKEG